MYQELSDMFKTFLYDTQNKIDKSQQTNEDYIADANNPNITKHKGRPPKRLQSNDMYQELVMLIMKMQKVAKGVNVVDANNMDIILRLARFRCPLRLLDCWVDNIH